MRPADLATDLTEADIRRRLDAIFDGGPVCAEDRRYALRLRGIEHREIADEVGTWRGVVSETLAGVRPGHRVRHAVARRVGVPVERLWPMDETR